MRTEKECAVGFRTLHPLAVFVAAALLLAAAGHCRAEAPSGPPDGSDASRASESAGDPSGSRDNAVAQDNTSSSPVLPAEATESPEAGGEAGEEEDFREPSFGDEPPPVSAADPIEPVNRGIFYVNDKMYRWVFRPVAQGYKYAVPEGVRTAVRNFFSNLGTPIRVVNTLLQGKLVATGTELARFGINSTIGMAGLIDAAKQFDLARKDEDTGQTLGVYGLGHGMYVVLPFLGPSSIRDAVGAVGDTLLDPLSYLPTMEAAIGARVLRSETELSFRHEQYDELTGAAVDPYIAVRDAYLQHREKRVKE